MEKLRITILAAAIMLLCVIPVYGAGSAGDADAAQPLRGSVDVSGLPDDGTLLREFMENTAAEELEPSAGTDQSGQNDPEDQAGQEDQADETGSEEPADSGTAGRSRTPGRDGLNARERAAYDYFVAEIRKVAAGERSDTKISIPAYEFMDRTRFTYEELGIDPSHAESGLTDEDREIIKETIGLEGDRLIDAALMDVPFELYWFDKTATYSYWNFGGRVSDYTAMDQYIQIEKDAALTILLRVTYDYSESGERGTSVADTAKTQAASRAAVNAADLVESMKYLSDFDKLCAYKEEICDMVDYDYDAASDGTYGEQWQMISVFDGDPDTSAVCEGYAKAFKFLCDLSEFRSPLVDAYLFSGKMLYEEDGISHEDIHMWNVVRMNDGKYYLADITNCDKDDEGSSDELFLAGNAEPERIDACRTAAPEDEGISYLYEYDYDTMNIYTDAQRTISDSDYEEGAEDDEEAVLDEKSKQEQGRSEDEEYRGSIEFNQDAIPYAEFAGKGGFEYTGKVIDPKIIVSTYKGLLTEGEDYTIVYKGNRRTIGKQAFTIRYMGRFEEEEDVSGYFAIGPAKAKIASAKAGPKKFVVKTKAQSGRVSYQIIYRMGTSGKWKTRTQSSPDFKVKDLKSDRKYQVKVRVYTNALGGIVYGEWSDVKTIKVK